MGAAINGGSKASYGGGGGGWYSARVYVGGDCELLYV